MYGKAENFWMVILESRRVTFCDQFRLKNMECSMNLFPLQTLKKNWGRRKNGNIRLNQSIAVPWQAAHQFRSARNFVRTSPHNFEKKSHSTTEIVNLIWVKLHRSINYEPHWPTNFPLLSFQELELRIETQKQTLQARDESIKKLLEMLQNKGMGEIIFSFTIVFYYSRRIDLV